VGTGDRPRLHDHHAGRALRATAQARLTAHSAPIALDSMDHSACGSS
jgi:hypothetical protein